MGVPGPASSGRTKAISRFLSDHQDHDAGFDVGRKEGSGTGRLRIVCLGCGKSIEYRAGEAAESPLEVLPDPRAHRSLARERERPRKPKAADRRPDGPVGDRPLAPRVIGILVAAALVLAAVLLLTDNGSEPSKVSRSTTPATVPVATAPAPPATPPPAEPQARPPRLHTATFVDRFRIGVPGAWRSGPQGTATALIGPGGTPEIDVYYALDSRGLGDLGSSAVRFLKGRHPAGKVAAPVMTDVGDLRGLRVDATYPDGSESAVVLTSDGYAYLLLERLDQHDDPFRVRQAAASVESFRPL